MEKQWLTLFFWAPKSLQMVAAMGKDTCSFRRKAMINLDSIFFFNIALIAWKHQYLLWVIPVKFSNIYTLRITKHSWCLNNIGFSYVVHWDTDYFSVQTTVLHHPHLAKSADGEPWLWRDNFKVIYKFVIVRRVFTLSPSCHSYYYWEKLEKI